ncbi:uncharacterized protein K444DRAFT_665150 [Hyaloscypha bicolor E]|uniref:Biotrophy-associated secreted protein 2 n=1 Tax=Hyaloscypha bicolor E TaxID=1095630 RepID=A0A2J6T3X8_9HELO|nr:uncharacterized protein K444DRAFT_665150 [Hyaloscypha bicolor E]PMD57623.1 hypothetical protein K444DRAFT_665150 [Hyaloscypha bicolor E]
MKSFTITTFLSLAFVAYAVPPFDPAGAKNVGNGAGGQFIGGQCLSNADCGSGCCANPTGICSGPGASTQNGKTGCGFGSTGSPAAAPASQSAAAVSVASTASAGGPAFDPAGAKNVGNGQGKQFIGGQCLSGADCASTCCAGPSGICSGLGAQTQAGKTGCGFVSGSSSGSVSSAVSAPAASSAPAAAKNAVAGTASAGGPAFDPAGAKNVGNGAGLQFIGGQCLSGSDCASTCCAGPSGICSGLGAQTQAGKTGCGFVSGSASNAVAAAPAASPVAVASSATAGGPAFDPAGQKNVGNGKGVQFIGGQCLSGADCASTCCAGPSGICSGLGAQTQAGKTGCGFVSSAKLLRV